jgi:hypothetical protein
VLAALQSRSDIDNPVVREHVHWALERHAAHIPVVPGLHGAE